MASKWDEGVLSILADEGVACAGYTKTGGNHLKFNIQYKGVNRNLFTSLTASDWRALQNVRRDVRKIKREIDERGGQ